MRGLIPAAGKGTRSGLDFPKTLQKVDGVPILVRLIRSLGPVVSGFSVVVSPGGREVIAAALDEYGLDAELIEQPVPLGMGDAVGCFAGSAHFSATEDIVLAWGDMLALPTSLARTVVDRFYAENCDLAFPTHFRNPCYTHVMRDADDKVTALLERREAGDALPQDGEADCGLFVFRKEPMFDVLQTRRDDLIGGATGEVGFLATVAVLASQGRRIDAYPIARGIDAASFNSPADLAEFARMSGDPESSTSC